MKEDTGKWSTTKAKLKQKFAVLSQNDLFFAEGKKDEMLERLPYDMMYLKNISLYIDFKILIYTLMVSFKGNGK